MTDTDPSLEGLIALANRHAFNQASSLAENCRSISVDEIVRAYQRQRSTAPSRHLVGKKYLSRSRVGMPGAGTASKRQEEHLAVALWHASHALGGLSLGDRVEGRLELLDYQTPLKAKRSDAGVGKVDLLGLVGNRLIIVELKVASGKDTPLRALLEGLSYCAIVEANLDSFADELRASQSRIIAMHPPGLIVAAPEEYWSRWDSVPSSAYQANLYALAAALTQRLNVQICLVALSIGELTMSLGRSPPRLNGADPAIRTLFGSESAFVGKPTGVALFAEA